MPPANHPRSPFASGSARPASLPLVFWVIWASMSGGVVLLRHFIAPATRSGPPASPSSGAFGPIELLCVGVALASLVVRFLVLPRLDSLQKKLPVFVVAMAMAEGSGVLGIFLARSHQTELFALRIACLALLAPVFTFPRAARFPRADA